MVKDLLVADDFGEPPQALSGRLALSHGQLQVADIGGTDQFRIDGAVGRMTGYCLDDERDGTFMRLPVAARAALIEMAEQIETLRVRIKKLDTKIVATVKENETARRLTGIPGVGPIIAATVRAATQDAATFNTGRDLAAWFGITPRANFSGGKERLG